MPLKIGTNDTVIAYWTNEQKFLNLVKQSSTLAGTCTDTTRHNSWTYGVGANMNLDANGWPTNFTGIGDAAGKTYSEIDFGLSQNSRIGNYVFLYSGGDSTTKFVFADDIAYVDGGSAAQAGAHVSNGRIICNVASTANQFIKVELTVVGATPPTDWALIYSPDSTISVVGTRETAYNNGQIFNPDYITKVSPFSVLRLMCSMDVIGNTSQVNWTDRPTANWWAWNDANRFGTSQPPVEVLIALMNYLYSQGNDVTPWFNMPVLANSTYVTNYATTLRDGNASAPAGLQAGLNSNIGCYVEFGNEIWNTASWGVNGIYQIAQVIGYPNYPGTKSATASFTGSISGTTLTVSAMTSGTISPSTTNNALFGAGITGFPLITTQNSGTAGGVGTYTLSASQGTIASEAMSQGSDFGAMFQGAIRLAILNGNIFKSVLGAGRVKTVLAGQSTFGGRNQYIMTALASDQGGNASDWVGKAAANADVFATAPYFFYGQGTNQIPEAFTANADGGLAALFQEATTGGILPTGFSTVTATDLSGGALLAGWTACKVTSGQSFTTTPANTSIFTVSFSAASGTNPTIQVDGGNTYPIQDYTGAATTVSAARLPLCFTSATSQGAVGTPGWRVEQFGFTDSTYGSGMIAASMCDASAYWTPGGQVTLNGFANDLKNCQNPSYGNGIPLVCYEGGQSWYPNNQAVYCALFPAANRAVGIKDVYFSYINAIQNLPNLLGYPQSALPLYNNFTLTGSYGGSLDNDGNFGACEYPWQAEPIPKYDALVEMATPEHPCRSWLGKF